MIYKYSKTFGNGDAGALHAAIEASLPSVVGVTWDSVVHEDDSTNLDVDFAAELSTEDKATLDSIVAAFDETA